MRGARAICWFSPPVRYIRKGVFQHGYYPFWNKALSVIVCGAKFVCFSIYWQFLIKNTNLLFHSGITSSGFSLVAIWFWKGVEDTNKRNEFSNLLFTSSVHRPPSLIFRIEPSYIYICVEFWPKWLPKIRKWWIS